MTSVQRLTSLTLKAAGKISLGGIFRSRLEFFFFFLQSGKPHSGQRDIEDSAKDL